MSLVIINTYKDTGKWYDEVIYETQLNPVQNESQFFNELQIKDPKIKDMNHTINCTYSIGIEKGVERFALYHRLIIKNN